MHSCYTMMTCTTLVMAHDLQHRPNHSYIHIRRRETHTLDHRKHLHKLSICYIVIVTNMTHKIRVNNTMHNSSNSISLIITQIFLICNKVSRSNTHNLFVPQRPSNPVNCTVINFVVLSLLKMYLPLPPSPQKSTLNAKLPCNILGVR